MDSYQQYANRDLSSTQDKSHDLMWVTYRWMSLGLALTGMVSFFVSQSPAAIHLIFGNRILFYALLFAELGVVMAFTPVVQRVSTAAAVAMFLFYAALNGVTLSAIFLAYTQASLAQTFLITAGTFGALSLYGSTTKRDLSAMGRFMMFGLIGLVIASLVNLFWANSALYWITTYVGVLVFAGLTAWDTQKLQTMFAARGGAQNLPLIGALILYLDFVNMFLFLLRLFGRRR